MATAPKRRFISANDQEQLIKEFRNNLADDEDRVTEEATTYFV